MEQVKSILKWFRADQIKQLHKQVNMPDKKKMCSHVIALLPTSGLGTCYVKALSAEKGKVKLRSVCQGLAVRV